MLGGYAGGQAEYVRVPFADVGPIKMPDGLADEQVLFLSDIFPTGYHGSRELQHPARRHHRGLGLRAGWPVRASRAPFCSGPNGSIAIDEVPERLTMARAQGKAETIDFAHEHVLQRLRELTGGRGPDACIDAVGLEAHGTSRRGCSTA